MQALVLPSTLGCITTGCGCAGDGAVATEPPVCLSSSGEAWRGGGSCAQNTRVSDPSGTIQSGFAWFPSMVSMAQGPLPAHPGLVRGSDSSGGVVVRAPPPARMPSGGMATERARLLGVGCSERAIDSMQSARAQGTARVYDGKGRIFESWCLWHAVDPWNASLVNIANVLDCQRSSKNLVFHGERLLVIYRCLSSED